MQHDAQTLPSGEGEHVFLLLQSFFCLNERLTYDTTKVFGEINNLSSVLCVLYSVYTECCLADILKENLKIIFWSL